VRRPWTCAALAALAYLAVASLLLRAVLPAPAARLPYPAALHASDQDLVSLDHYDQAMVVATVTRNADRILRAPWTLREGGQCFPMPRSYTLGEHMFGVGLLAAPAYALTGDPILSYNAALLLTLWIPALAMYAFAACLTRSPAAAFVAGLAFALVPGRVIDPTHPYVHGDLWAPLALLFLHRLLSGGGLRDAAGLAAALALEVAESLYSLLATGLYVAVYALFLLRRRPREAVRKLPLLAAVGAVVAVAAWLVLGPYLEVRATWGVLSGRFSYPLVAEEFLPGREHFPGFVVLGLAAVALLDRVRGPRGLDPRLAITAAAVLIVWCALGRVRVPFTSMVLPSPLLFARGIVPGLDAVRALHAIALGAGLAFALLSAYGVIALAERFGRSRSVPVAIAVSLALLATTVWGPLARASFGRTLRLTAWEARPPDAEIALVERSAPGAVLDVPVPFVEGDVSFKAGPMLLLASYGPRESAACYNSFGSPVQKQVWHLARELPARPAAAALSSLGFETVLAREGDRSDDEHVRRDLGGAGSGLVERDRAGDLVSYGFAPRGETSEDFAHLERPAEPPPRAPAFVAPSPTARVSFLVTNHGAATFRHPQPLAPSELLVRWTPLDGRGETHERPARALLPIALGSGATMPIEVELALPDEPGLYRATLARAGAPDRALAARDVDVVSTAASTPGAERETSDLGALVPGDEAQPLVVSGTTAALSFRVVSRGASYRDPSPRSLRRLRLEWIDATGGEVAAERLGVYVPPRIPAGASASVEVSALLPPPGRYVARLVPVAGDRSHVVAERLVEVVREDAP
jgi:hypothetical protein